MSPEHQESDEAKGRRNLRASGFFVPVAHFEAAIRNWTNIGSLSHCV
jgi:hypothetical protein